MEKIKQNKYINMAFDWIIRIIGYALILMVTSLIFKNTLYIDNSYFGFWCFLAAIIIYLLNKTIKPFLVWLTIPITGLTLGLFYPFINLIILKIVSLILQNHFEIYGVWFAFFASILISILNVILDMTVIQKIKRKGANNESTN